MTLRAKVLAVLLAVLAVGRPLRAQETPAAPIDTTQNSALRAFLDCDVRGCDREFLVSEMKWVNWMRDRLDADFHILVTSQETGSGGRQYVVVAIGQRAFQGKVDTLGFTSNPNDAEDVIRQNMKRVMGQLLVPYAARGALGARLTISYEAPSGTAAPAAARDKWDFWVLSLSMNGFMNGESQQTFRNGWFENEAKRTTDKWKVRVGTFYSYDESKFTYMADSVTEVTTLAIQRSWAANTMIVKSLGDHWSVGGRAGATHSDFRNLETGIGAAAAIEWDLYPYRDFARKKVTALYAVGVQSNRYVETTIYGRDNETRPAHTLDVTYAAKQKWGQAEVTLSGSQFLDGLKYYTAGVSGGVNVRLGRGFSFNIDGSLSRVRDQLYLPLGGADPAEVLTRLKALQTNYRYFTFFGIQYQFGSIFNSVVNPRFNRFGDGRGFALSF